MTQIWLVLVMVANMAAAWRPFDAQFAQSAVGRNVMICIDGQQVHQTFAGKLGFRDNSGVWYSVCANVRAPIMQGQIMTIQPANSAKVGGNIAKAGNIVARYFREAQTPDQCAGLQIAVWKAIEDGTDYPDFSTGRFQVNANPSVLAFAQQYYQATQSPAPSLFLAAAGGGQSQLTPTLQ